MVAFVIGSFESLPEAADQHIKDPRQHSRPHDAQMEADARKAFGGDDNERYATEGSIGMDIMEMFSDMPLVSVLMFQKDALPAHPEDMVADLLQQVHS